MDAKLSQRETAASQNDLGAIIVPFAGAAWAIQ
jgi:hypothetical protein